jgi:hypothetical protein
VRRAAPVLGFSHSVARAVIFIFCLQLMSRRLFGSGRETRHRSIFSGSHSASVRDSVLRARSFFGTASCLAAVFRFWRQPVCRSDPWEKLRFLLCLIFSLAAWFDFARPGLAPKALRSDLLRQWSFPCVLVAIRWVFVEFLFAAACAFTVAPAHSLTSLSSLSCPREKKNSSNRDTHVRNFQRHNTTLALLSPHLALLTWPDYTA